MPSTQKSKDELRKEQERQEAAPARKKSRKAKGEAFIPDFHQFGTQPQG